MSLVDILGTPVDDSSSPEPPPQHSCRVPPPIEPAPASTPHRGSRLWVTFGVALALFVGAVAGWFGSGLTTGSSTVVGETPGLPAEIAGYAELYTARELSAVADGDQQRIWINQTAAIAGEPVDDHTWSVTVAVDALELADTVYEPADLQEFNVLVTSVGDKPTAIGLPSRVPIAAVVDQTASLFSDPVPDDQAVAAMAFIQEYLTGGDELSRYLASPSNIVRFDTAPYQEIAARPLGANLTGEIRIGVVATKSNGITHQLQYVLTMAISGGVWVVADVAPAAV
ncbi:MAG: conjugal transfer protein [Acidimicrobiia bacterium]